VPVLIFPVVERDARGQSGDRLGQGGGPTKVIVSKIDARRGVRDGRHLACDIVGGGDGTGGRTKSAWPRAKRCSSIELGSHIRVFRYPVEFAEIV
jgi:hypothetical protein